MGNYVGVAAADIQTFVAANWTKEVLNSAWEVSTEEANLIIHQFQQHPSEKLVVNHDLIQSTLRHKRTQGYFHSYLSLYDLFLLTAAVGFYVYLLVLFFRAFCSHYLDRLQRRYVFFARRQPNPIPAPTDDPNQELEDFQIHQQ